MATFVAISPREGLALFDVNGKGVVVNTRNLDVCDPVPLTAALKQTLWTRVAPGAECPPAWLDLASAATSTLAVKGTRATTAAGSGRIFRIPKGVQQEALKALGWHRSNGGADQESAVVGRRLASGEPAVIADVQMVYAYFAKRNASELDVTAPADDRVAWSLHGGAAGLRWAANLLRRNGVLNMDTVSTPMAPPIPEPVASDAPHEFVPSVDDPTICEICQLTEEDPLHMPAAIATPEALPPADDVAPEAVPYESDPTQPHAFEADPDGLCVICGRGEEDPLHVMVASSFAFDATCDYFGVKESNDPADTNVVSLLMKTPDDTWSERRGNEWAVVEPPTGEVDVIELDEESATKLADIFDDTDEISVALSAISPPEEWEMFLAADAEIDWEAVDRVYDVYDPIERSVNAGRQARDTGGRFGGGGGGGASPAGGGGSGPGAPAPGAGPETAKPAKARLSSPLPLVEDVKALIDEYLATALAERAAASGVDQFADQPVTDIPIPVPETPEAPAGENPDTSEVRPLYLAIVDDVDTEAVLDVVALIPSDGSTDVLCFKRDEGSWTPDEESLRLLRGITPPPVVELDDAVLQEVLTQMDPAGEVAEEGDIASDGAPIMASAAQLTIRSARVRERDAARGYALRDGSFPIHTVHDLVTAVRVSNTIDSHRHVMKRARALGRFDLIPAEWKGNAIVASMLTPLWGPNGEILSLQAAGVPGVADTPGDIKNVQRLQRYWSHGEGAAKVKWGVDGDWKRCVKLLSKYMGTRAKGYCTLRHHEATGSWPGKGPHASLGAETSSTVEAGLLDAMTREIDDGNVLKEFGLRTAEQYIAVTAAAAEAAQEIDGVPAPSDASEVKAGAPFRIPLLIPEGVPSGDGRQFAANSLTTRDMPISLYWQIQTDEGHTGSVVVGRIDHVERIENGLGNATGVFDTGPYGREAERLVREKMLRGISGDLDNFEAEVEEMTDETKVASNQMVVNKARVMAATLVGKPAFQECYIELTDDSTPLEQEAPVSDGVYEEDRPIAAAAEYALAAMAASAAPVAPPIEWFDNPVLQKPTALTVTDDGRVFGHIAAWDIDHIGMAFGTRPPKSRSNYAYFQTGVLKTEQGKDVRVGQLTLAGGHAPLNADAAGAIKHYDDTASAVADVSAGEDLYGIWVAGALRPSVSTDQVRVLRASSPSGDWRPINGALELVAVCQVNVPGFPVTRTMVAAGQVTALVAAGASSLARLREEPMTLVDQRLASLEAFEHSRLLERRLALSARFAPAINDYEAALAAKIEKARSSFAPYREAEAALNTTIASLRERVFGFKPHGSGLRARPDFDEHEHPRSHDGKFRRVFARLMESLTDDADQATQDAVKDIEKAADQEDAGDSQAAEKTAGDAKARLDDIAETTADPAAADQARAASEKLSQDVMDQVTDAASDTGEGVAFGDLPPEVQDLINQAIDQFLQQPVQGAIGTLQSRLKEWATGEGFASIEDIARLLAAYLMEKVRPQ